MEYLDSTAKASLMVLEASRNQETGERMDPQGQQEIGDCQEEDTILNPDFANLNTDDLISLRTKTEQFREIKIGKTGFLIHKTGNVNVYQKKGCGNRNKIRQDSDQVK